MKKTLNKISLSLVCFGLMAFLLLTGILSLTPSLEPSAARAADKPIILKFATHLPSIHHGYVNLIKPWAEEVGKRTDGRVKVRIYTDQQLGKLPEMYDRLVDGTCDIAFIIPVFIRGRFPLEGAFHVPTLIPGDSWDPVCTEIRTMVYEKYLIPRYFQDVKILWTGRFGLNNIHMAEKPVRNLEDMKGKVIGFPGGKTPPLVLGALAASAEMIRSPDIYTSLERKVIDGMMFPLDGLRGYKLAEVVKYTTLVNWASASNFTAINKKSWNKLAPADQKVITDLIPWAMDAQGKTYREDSELAIETGKKAGIEFIELSPEETKRWDDKLQPVVKEWVADMDGQGMPASALYEDIQKIINK